MTTLHARYEHCGQSPWVDNLRRAALASGELGRLVAAGVRGVTSNPTIFQRSVLGGGDYDAQLRSLAAPVARSRSRTGRWPTPTSALPSTCSRTRASNCSSPPTAAVWRAGQAYGILRLGFVVAPRT